MSEATEKRQNPVPARLPADDRQALEALWRALKETADRQRDLEARIKELEG